MGLTRISSLVLGGREIEQPSPEYFLPLVQVPNLEFCKFFKSGLRFPNGALSSRCMFLTMVRQFDHLLPTLRLICGVLGRESVAYLGYLFCRAKEWFARGGTWSNSDLIESQMFRGEGEMDSHFWKHFWVILLNLLFELFLLRIMGTFFFFFFLFF